MGRKLRLDKRRIEIPEEALYLLSDELLGDPPDLASVQWFQAAHDSPLAEHSKLRQYWEQERDAILDAWIETYPATRPSYWWKFESRESRLRLGGTGDATFDVLNEFEYYDFGIPASFIGPLHISLFKRGVAVDPDDPPVFESEASYLSRLGLLTESEHEYLQEHPEAFEPDEIVPTAVEEDPEEDEDDDE